MPADDRLFERCCVGGKANATQTLNLEIWNGNGGTLVGGSFALLCNTLILILHSPVTLATIE